MPFITTTFERKHVATTDETIMSYGIFQSQFLFPATAQRFVQAHLNIVTFQDISGSGTDIPVRPTHAIFRFGQANPAGGFFWVPKQSVWDTVTDTFMNTIVGEPELGTLAANSWDVVTLSPGSYQMGGDKFNIFASDFSLPFDRTFAGNGPSAAGGLDCQCEISVLSVPYEIYMIGNKEFRNGHVDYAAAKVIPYGDILNMSIQLHVS